MSCSTPVSAKHGCLTVQDTERLVNRLKNTNPEKFCSLVQMHLSFLLDLSGSSLEEFLCTEDSENDHKSVSKLFASFGKKRCHKDRDTKPSCGIFGQALKQEAIEVIFPLLDFLKRPECLAEEGLFRKSGQAVRQRSLQDALNSGNKASQVEEDLLNGIYTAHDCASVIKVFLRELPEPLLTSRHYIAYTQIPGMNSSSKQMQTVQLLIQLLPPENAFLLRVLLELLHRVATEPTNKMTADTLATLFAPHLLVPRTTNAYDLQTESCNVTAVVSFMITHHSEMFDYPITLVRDIQLYWDDMDGGYLDLNKTSASREGLCSDDDLDSCSCPRFRKRVDPLDKTLNTTLTFVNRQGSNLNSSEHTSKQIAELYAYVSKMPDSPQKRKFVKQFSKYSHNNGTPVLSQDAKNQHHAATSSLGGSIKKMMGKTPAKRKHSYDLAQQSSVAMGEACYTPLAKSQCYNGDNGEVTPARAIQCAQSLRRQIQDSMHVQCSKLPMGSSHSSLSSSSSTESCESCTIDTTGDHHPALSRTRSTSTCSTCPEHSPSNPHNNNNNHVQQSPKCLTSHRSSNSQMLNVLKNGLPHMCIEHLAEENKENYSPAVVLNSRSSASPVLKAVTSERNLAVTADTCGACLCEPMDISMESPSAESALSKSSSFLGAVSQMSSPLARTATTPTCIRA